MSGDAGVNQLDADRPEPIERTLFVVADQPRVSRHIRGKNGGKTAGRGHFAPSLVASDQD
jgi:hypothetical protein